MGKTGISIPNMSKDDAKNIVDTYSRNEIYLKSIIRKYVKNPKIPVDDMDYTELLHHGHVISGVAQKILKNSPKRQNLEQLSLFS